MTVPTYSAPYPTAPPPHRPITVTIASVLLFVVAAVQVVFAMIAFSTFDKAAPIYDDAYAGTDFESFGSALATLSVVMIILYGIIAVGMVILGVFNLRGKQPARVITWIFSGVLMCCSVVLPYMAVILITRFAEAVDDGSGAQRLPTQRELDARLNDVVPGWFSSVAVLFTLFALASLIVVIILLSVPASNRFFRKQVAGWNPYQTGYPQQPAYGQPYPGPYGQQPGAQDPGYGQPGQPAPGLPPYPGQQPSGPPSYGAPAGYDPYAQPGQPYPGQPQPGQQFPGQQFPGQQYPGQAYPGSAYPGQPGYPPPSDPGAAYGSPPSDPLAAPHGPPSEHGPASDPWASPAPPAAPQSSPPADQPPASPPGSSPTDEQRPPHNPI
ncbi:hypothetical protein [Actinoplanes palleronii]|uniref:hypothetical protein n=1 Tax=Actinoplanes palleronii TaxID=113570 RepID=UPI001940D694|nr:hypothetical protein [Actinoplanes palleronii]